jgi:hypothetical protein
LEEEEFVKYLGGPFGGWRTNDVLIEFLYLRLQQLKREIPMEIEEKMMFGCFDDLEIFDIERRNVGLILELIKNLFMKLSRIDCECIGKFRNDLENRSNVCLISIY